MNDATPIQFYLEKKYKKLKPSRHNAKKQIVVYLQAFFPKKKSIQTVAINGQTLFVNAPPAVKNELFFRKEEIFIFCKKTLGIKITALR